MLPNSCAMVPEPVSSALAVFEGHHHGLRQHIEFIAAAVQAYIIGPQNPAAAASKNCLYNHLHDLRRFSETHFANEEKLMQDVDYPQRAAHAQRHREFLDWLGRLERTSYHEPRRLRSASPGTVLAGWWEAHATGQDRALTEFLCRGGY